jgi:hypothetical protein
VLSIADEQIERWQEFLALLRIRPQLDSVNAGMSVGRKRQ